MKTKIRGRILSKDNSPVVDTIFYLAYRIVNGIVKDISKKIARNEIKEMKENYEKLKKEGKI